MSNIVKTGWVDERPPIARLQRHEYWALADRYGVDYPAGATSNEMVRIFEGAVARGLDLNRPPPPKPVAPPAPVIAAPKRLEDLTVFQLRRECKAAGIPFEQTDKKVALLAKLAPPLGDAA